MEASEYWYKTAAEVRADLKTKLNFELLSSILKGTPSGDLDEKVLMACVTMILQNNEV